MGLVILKVIDKAWTLGTGAPKGPFQILDTVGLTTAYNIVSMYLKVPSFLAPYNFKGMAKMLKKYIDEGKLGMAFRMKVFINIRRIVFLFIITIKRDGDGKMVKKVLYVAIDKLTKEVYKFKQWSECQKLVSEGKYVYKGFSQEELKDVESYIASFKQTMDESQLNLNEKDVPYAYVDGSCLTNGDTCYAYSFGVTIC